MLNAIVCEIRERKNYLAGHKIETLYFGGGTPSVCSPQQMQLMIDVVKEVYGSLDFSEITMEANPEDLIEKYLEELSGTDVNRLSIGIQSFNDRHLKFFNRRHDSGTAYNSVINAKKYGFDNINIDLIYGVPGMSLSEWEQTLDKFIKLDVPHLSAYHLGIEDKTILGKRRQKGLLHPVAEEESMSQYALLEKVASASDYEHYEISNFAKTGMRAVHNSNYWKGLPYIGIGPSAHSFNGVDERRWNISSNNIYLREIKSGNYFEIEKLSDNDRYNEFILTSLRTSDGVDLELLLKKFGKEKYDAFIKIYKKLTLQGLVNEKSGKLYVPSENFLLSNHIISEFFIRIVRIGLTEIYKLLPCDIQLVRVM